MKRLILAAALVLAPLGASAQTPSPYVPPPPPPPLGPFAIAMSAADARAAAPGAEWQIIDDHELHRGSMRTAADAIELHGVRFRATMTYSADAISLVRLSAELPLAQPECAARHRALVEAEAPARRTLAGRDYWHRFYEDPDAPIGHMENGELISAPSFDARNMSEPVPPTAAPVGYAAATYLAPGYNQSFYSSVGAYAEFTALSFARAGAPVCQIVMQITSPVGDAGARVSDGEGGVDRLATRLAGAEFLRPLTYLQSASGRDVSRYYPGRALERAIEGYVRVNCLVLADGRLDCAVMEETPIDYAFGLAALRIVRGNRVDVFSGDAAGKRTEFAIRFMLPS
ncbi:MAG: energy transducer TonB [Alphaproteobacteria bacterium]|nr:energy transducer TonB [Alphaproteobacteria bacterium]